VHLNYHNNVVFRGPSFTATGNYPVGLYAIDGTTPHGFQVYISGNSTFRTRIPNRFGQTVTDDQLLNAGYIPGTQAAWICGINAAGNRDCSVNPLSTTVQAQIPGQPFVKSISSGWITDSQQAARAVMKHAGAELCRGASCRDYPTTYFLEDFRTCDATPKFWESGVIPGGEWSSTDPLTRVHLYAGYMQGGPVSAPLTDTDHDGMPDDWETAHGLQPTIADGNADPDADGYTNLEEYLAEMALDHQRYKGFIETTGAGEPIPAYNCGYARTP
jgi:hypothetical protein